MSDGVAIVKSNDVGLRELVVGLQWLRRSMNSRVTGYLEMRDYLGLRRQGRTPQVVVMYSAY